MKRCPICGKTLTICPHCDAELPATEILEPVPGRSLCGRCKKDV